MEKDSSCEINACQNQDHNLIRIAPGKLSNSQAIIHVMQFAFSKNKIAPL
jgi:hypothetical protein